MFDNEPTNKSSFENERTIEEQLSGEENSWNDRLLYRVKQTVQKAMGISTQPPRRASSSSISSPSTTEDGLYSSVRQIAQNRVSVALKQLRAQHGLSYEQIQRKTGLSQQLLWDMEFNNRRLSLDELRLLADCYELPVNDLLGVDVDPPTLDKLKIHDRFSLPPNRSINQ